MPINTTEQIAEAAMTLLMDKNVKKLTVKNIVEECGITRQAFYYHFEDIPHLFRWIFEKSEEHILAQARESSDPEEELRRFFLMAIHTMPYVKKGLESNYGNELEALFSHYFCQLFEQLAEKKDMYKNCTRLEAGLILRYHSYAIIGLLQNWTDADTKNLEQIVHLVYLLISEGISPSS